MKQLAYRATPAQRMRVADVKTSCRKAKQQTSPVLPSAPHGTIFEAAGTTPTLTATIVAQVRKQWTSYEEELTLTTRLTPPTEAPHLAL
jgi:hypothetical protein